MNTIITSSRRDRHGTGSRRSVAVRVVTLLLLALGLIAQSTPNAAAISRYSLWQGSPGAIVQSSQVTGSPTYALSRPSISMIAAHVRRSPLTSGNQTVVYEYRLYGWNGTTWWGGTANHASQVIPAGQNTIALTGGGFGGANEFTGLPAGFYAVELTATFYSASGQFLGRFKVWHDQAGDYMCRRTITNYGSCQVYSAGYIRLS